MTKDPYKVLGVNRSDNMETIKKAYRDLAKKYHPDNYVGNDLADLAEEKMKEINEAYDIITKEHDPSSRGYAYQGQTGTGSARYEAIRNAINSGNLDYAQSLLDEMNDTGDAEWHFLYGALAYRRGWFDEASRHVNEAVRLDPGNYEYQTAANQMNQGANGYRRAPGSAGGANCNACDCCTALICADCLCDAVRCC